MFLKKILLKRPPTLALRLTIWHAAIFALSSLLAFTLAYVLIATVVQQHTDQDLQEDIAEYAGFMRLGGFDKVKAETVFETQGEEASTVFFRLWTRDGHLMAATDLTRWPGLATLITTLPPLHEGDEPILKTVELPEREYAVRSIYGAIGPDIILEIGESLENDQKFLAALLNGFFVALLAVIALGAPIGWFMARRALRGVEEVTRTAMEIADGALNQRVAVGSQGDELDRLAQAFNTMLDRIQALIFGMREMTDNLAHDLRSPVARIRASAEIALTSDASRTDWQTMASDTTEECDRLLEMINTTLDIAEAESGVATLCIGEVDLAALVIDACDLFQTIAEDKHIALHTDLPPQCLIRGDLQRLQRVVANLLDNALKYTPAGGRIAFRLIDETERVYLTISDTGVGISATELPKIFQRFYRCDWSRSEYGNGLGLSLALAFIHAHGGDITVQSAPSQGSVFTVILSRSHCDG